ncbi:PucR family transcriptional regulator [Knoellia sp. Soil729]|uniref:PucR family transcriptional regulator n=1 Tax=Knoellia sp. Soil729 TaxID=1736394 RepID=UPI0006FCE5E6|nr:PucR family transcriptional regulator [Knoellia sp. Soil729]KRE43988.1 hypothetical protein ASG74_03945 [Knoellia sp. Soil729]
MTTAALAQALGPTFVRLSQPGEDRPVLGLEIVEASDPARAERGDLVVAVGVRTDDEALALVEASSEAAGLILRRPWADVARVRERCADLALPLLVWSEDATWTAALAALRSAVEVVPGTPEHGRTDHVFSDLFEMADTISAILDAPVTIEDATSRVLAYSHGQTDVDAARMSTIVGRRVPREMRDHFRSLGVFKRLAHSDEPFLVPAGANDVRARYVVPVRAGGEWLGSIWAVVDGPATEDRLRRLPAATELVALSLLRLRAQTELHHHVQLDQVRRVLRGSTTDQPRWLDDGPWHVAALEGPADLGADARRELWLSLCLRHGWRQPLVADLDSAVYAILRGQRGAGSQPWLADLVRARGQKGSGTRMVVGSEAITVGQVEQSRTDAAELLALPVGATPEPVICFDAQWPAIVLSRAVRGQVDRPLASPLADLLKTPGHAKTDWPATLEAVIDHWGEPQKAARGLGVHPNTIRYRLARLAELCPVNLDDPRERLALRLEIARLRQT